MLYPVELWERESQTPRSPDGNHLLYIRCVRSFLTLYVAVPLGAEHLLAFTAKALGRQVGVAERGAHRRVTGHLLDLRQ